MIFLVVDRFPMPRVKIVLDSTFVFNMTANTFKPTQQYGFIDHQASEGRNKC